MGYYIEICLEYIDSLIKFTYIQYSFQSAWIHQRFKESLLGTHTFFITINNDVILWFELWNWCNENPYLSPFWRPAAPFLFPVFFLLVTVTSKLWKFSYSDDGIIKPFLFFIILSSFWCPSPSHSVKRRSSWLSRRGRKTACRGAKLWPRQVDELANLVFHLVSENRKIDVAADFGKYLSDKMIW